MNGQQMPWMRRVGLDLFSKRKNIVVYCSRGRVALKSPYIIKKLLAAYYLTFALHEVAQYLELFG